MASDTLERIREIRDILQSGLKTTTVDGIAVNIDHDTLRRELMQLEIQAGQRKARPAFRQIVLG